MAALCPPHVVDSSRCWAIPVTGTGPLPLTYDQFRYAFANAVSDDEARQLYDSYTWIDQGTDYFVRRGLTATDARDLMLAILGMLEGAFILSRTLRSAEALYAAGRPRPRGSTRSCRNVGRNEHRSWRDELPVRASSDQ